MRTIKEVLKLKWKHGYVAPLSRQVRGVLMSMWAVPDRETKELMVSFYRNIQSGTMNRFQALRQAALSVILAVYKILDPQKG